MPESAFFVTKFAFLCHHDLQWYYVNIAEVPSFVKNILWRYRPQTCKDIAYYPVKVVVYMNGPLPQYRIAVRLSTYFNKHYHLASIIIYAWNKLPIPSIARASFDTTMFVIFYRRAWFLLFTSMVNVFLSTNLFIDYYFRCYLWSDFLI